jgi:hypothetical protein
MAFFSQGANLGYFVKSPENPGMKNSLPGYKKLHPATVLASITF